MMEVVCLDGVAAGKKTAKACERVFGAWEFYGGRA